MKSSAAGKFAMIARGGSRRTDTAYGRFGMASPDMDDKCFWRGENRECGRGLGFTGRLRGFEDWGEGGGGRWEFGIRNGRSIGNGRSWRGTEAKGEELGKQERRKRMV
jgi:hypothetical protein